MTCRLKSRHARKHIQSQPLQRDVVGMESVPREGGGSVSEPLHKLERIFGWVLITVSLGVALLSTVIAADSFANGYTGEGFVGVACVALWGWIALRVRTDLSKRDDKAPSTHPLGGEDDSGAVSTGGKG